MVEPEPAIAPVILPVIVPIVHEKVLGAVAVKAIFVLIPLQTETAAIGVISGIGFTVTVIVCGLPTQDPAMEVGVTMYSTVPTVELLGLVSA
jgi:hypothetical protein